MKYRLKNKSTENIAIDGFVLGNEEIPLLTLDIIGKGKQLSILMRYALEKKVVITESGVELSLDETNSLLTDLYILSVNKKQPLNSKIAKSFNTMYGNDLIDKIDNLDMKQKTIAEYRYHTENGVKFYEDFRADLAIGIATGQASAEASFHIEARLSPIKGMLLAGDWRTAQFACSQLEADEFLSQTLIDQVQNGFDNYVAQNF
jgi:hypothetical protein